MKKVLFVTNTMGRAGAERTLIALLEAFDRERYDISLFSIIPKGEFFDDVPEYVTILNKKYTAESVMNKSGIMGNMALVIKALLKNCYFLRFIPYGIRNLFGQLKRGKFSFDKLFWMPLAMSAPTLETEFDLAVAYIEGAASYYVAKKVKAKRKATFIHIDYELSGYVPKLDKPYFEQMDKIFCVSQSVKDGFKKVFPTLEGRTDFFQNTISDTFVLRSAQEKGGFDDGFSGLRLLTVGRLHPQKAYDMAIPAFSRILKETGLDVRWYVLGEGMERPRLEKMIAEYGLQDRFFLLGAVSNPYPYIRQCDIYVHCTRYEGWCIATAEAKILHKPIIASNTAGIAEQLSTDSSVIIELSEDNIVSAVSDLLLHPEKRLSLIAELEKGWKRPNDAYKLYELLEQKETVQ